MRIYEDMESNGVIAMRDDILLTPIEAAAFLKKSRTTLACWRCQGRGPAYYKVEGTIRYGLDTLRAYVGRPADIISQKMAEMGIGFPEAVEELARKN